MTEAADLVLTNARVHTLSGDDGLAAGSEDSTPDAEAVAIRDGEVVGVGSAYDIDFLADVETTVVDLDGAVVVPGFIDAHTHLESTGQYLVHADLSGAGSVDEVVETLRNEDGSRESNWLQGFGWDESDWPEGRYLLKEDLDLVSEDQPVVAFRVDMHMATLNSAALEQVRSDLPEADVQFDSGEPTGIIVEDAVGAVHETIGRGVAETRELVTAARDRALELGVTCVHDKVRDSHAPRVYRELDLAGELDLRVRIDYWSDHFEALLETGLRTNHGSGLVQTGGIKSFTDGSFGGRTAKLTESYADGDGTGQWVVDPETLREIVGRVDDADLQMVTHAIGDAAIEETIAAYEETDDPGTSRHRIEHVELASDDQIERMAKTGMVASCQPNFLQWAGDGGLYDQRLGESRRRASNRFRDLLDSGVPLAFGSDSMPLGPLEGVHHAVNAPDKRQRLSVTEAMRAYTVGAAYAGFDEHRLGTIEAGKLADLVVLDQSPWDTADAIQEIDVVKTVVDGEIVYEQE